MGGLCGKDVVVEQGLGGTKGTGKLCAPLSFSSFLALAVPDGG